MHERRSCARKVSTYINFFMYESRYCDSGTRHELLTSGARYHLVTTYSVMQSSSYLQTQCTCIDKPRWLPTLGFHFPMTQISNKLLAGESVPVADKHVTVHATGHVQLSVSQHMESSGVGGETCQIRNMLSQCTHAAPGQVL